MPGLLFASRNTRKLKACLAFVLITGVNLMVVIGLGSNMGDKLEHLRKALRIIRKMPDVVVKQVSPVYYSEAMLPDNAPADWDMPYLNLALRCDTHLDAIALLKLLKKVEVDVGEGK